MLWIIMPVISGPLSNYTMKLTLLCQLKTFPPSNIVVFFHDCHHSSTVRQGVLIVSLMRYYLSIFHKHLPLHSSFPSNFVLWGSGFGALSKCWRHSTESWESEVQGWGVVVISHLTVHYMECWSCLSGGGSDIHNATISNSAGAVVFGSEWRTSWLMHCYPEPIDPFSVAGGHFSTERHSTWIDWSKTMSTPFTQRLPEASTLTPPSHTHRQYTPPV